MEFGRVESAQLRKIDFSLPPEPADNASVLSGGQTKTITWLGNAKWGRREWVGKLYPPKTPQRRYLEEYTHSYNCIELNATHYKIHGAAAIAAWAAVPGEKAFLFCPKMYQGVTHRGKLAGKAFLTGEFLRGISAFKEHLGPIFLQFPDNFGPGRASELFDFLHQLPTSFQFFLELRHPGWFTQSAEWQSLLILLKELKIGLVITDTAGRRDCCHMQLTIPSTFIRFVGNSLHATDYKRCDAWVERIARWQEEGLNELYFFMHMHDETFSPELSAYLAKKLNGVLDLPVHVPEIHPELAAKPGKPRGINEKFKAGLEAAVSRREALGKSPAATGKKRVVTKESVAKKQAEKKKPIVQKPTAKKPAAKKKPIVNNPSAKKPTTKNQGANKSSGAKKQIAKKKSADKKPKKK